MMTFALPASLPVPPNVTTERYQHENGIEFRFFANHKAVSAFRLAFDDYDTGYWNVVNSLNKILYCGYDDQAAANAIKQYLSL
jgi:hypothetical protein